MDWRYLKNWGGRIRTSECLDQNQVPYRLATPQREDTFFRLEYLSSLLPQAVNLYQRLS